MVGKKIIDEFGINNLGLPCIDLYCMNLSFEVARKSLDPDSKNGCLAVDPDGGILSAGYNSPPQGSADEEIPLTRPDKYIFFEHSERNCIYIATRHGTSLMGSVFYLTGFPCIECLRAMIQVKIKKIIYGGHTSVMTNTKEYISRYPLLLKKQSIIIERFKYDEGLYRFNPRIRELIRKREVTDIRLEYNV